MLLVGVGFEIGVVNAVGQRGMVDGQHAVFVFGRDAEPILTVVRGARLIIFPALRISRICRIFKVHHAILIRRTLQAEVKPLGKIGSVVRTQGEADIGRVGQVFDDDGAGIKLSADFNHGKVLGISGEPDNRCLKKCVGDTASVGDGKPICPNPLILPFRRARPQPIRGGECCFRRPLTLR